MGPRGPPLIATTPLSGVAQAEGCYEPFAFACSGLIHLCCGKVMQCGFGPLWQWMSQRCMFLFHCQEPHNAVPNFFTTHASHKRVCPRRLRVTFYLAFNLPFDL
jgi:hypothetical protein